MRTALILVLPALLLGLVIGVQWQTQATRSPIATRYSADLATAATEMQREQDGLRVELAAVRAELDAVREQAASLDVRAASLKGGIDDLEDAAGLSPLGGEGVVITLDDGRLPASAPRRSIELAIVHSQDITDVFNAAWKAGALGISVNGERVTSATACVGATIQVNGRLMSPPFAVSVVGPADALMKALGDARELGDLKRRGELYGLRLGIDRAARVELPAYTGPIPVRHAIPAT
ncbi:MAG TPA: DUF881 domain-containing protein [Gemmatimonadaceae bacterium]|nr:MAG: hypothetical protein A2082_02850 [Chloroflexi bacterium GWC2_70_10]